MFRIVFISLLVACLHLNAKHKALSLQNAINTRLVTAKASSLGGHQGFCMKVDLKNLSKDSLVILIEAGRRLNSVEDKNQDILVVKEMLVVLSSGQERSVNVKGYCCQATHHSPPGQAKYAINTLADSGLVTLARYLNAGKYNSAIEQQAVWSVSDHQSTAAIAGHNDSLVLPLRRLVAGIKGEVLPWYTVLSKTYVYSNGVIAVFPLLLKGKLEYAAAKDSYTTLRILNDKGLPVCFVKSEWLKATALRDYDLSIPLRGLAGGKYTVELRSADQQLAKKEFEL